MADLFTTLDRDWHHQLHQPTTHARYRQWAGHDPALSAHPDLGAAITAAHRRDRSERSDRVLGALAARACHDTLAARALLYAISPGLRSLANRYYWLVPPDELQANLVAIAWGHIRAYPYVRRPRSIAANLLLDINHHFRRTLHQAHGDGSHEVPLDHAEALEYEPACHPARELTALVCDAVVDGDLPPADAELILRSRILDEPVTDIARRLGQPPDTLRHRRRRAENALRDAG